MQKQTIKQLYANIDHQTARYNALREQFRVAFAAEPTAAFSVPGRVEICGNHTDHQGGVVMGASVNLDIVAVCKPNNDNAVRLSQVGRENISVSLADTTPRPEDNGRAQALVRGVADGLKQRGYAISGVSATIDNEVPGGAGLSSSAAFSVLIGAMLSACEGQAVSTRELAEIAHYAEREHFGKPCGMLDQLACATGGMQMLDFGGGQIDLTAIPADFSDYSLCITTPGGDHTDLTDEYSAIVAEMFAVAAHFEAKKLSEISLQQVIAAAPALREKCGDRAVLRAVHYFNECTRVHRAADGLKCGNIDVFLAQLKLSGDSSHKYLQNVTYINQPQNLATALLLSETLLDGCGATRVHGGGFEGTILAFVPSDRLDDYVTAMNAAFGKGACNPLQVREFGAVQVDG